MSDDDRLPGRQVYQPSGSGLRANVQPARPARSHISYSSFVRKRGIEPTNAVDQLAAEDRHDEMQVVVREKVRELKAARICTRRTRRLAVARAAVAPCVAKYHVDLRAVLEDRDLPLEKRRRPRVVAVEKREEPSLRDLEGGIARRSGARIRLAEQLHALIEDRPPGDQCGCVV